MSNSLSGPGNLGCHGQSQQRTETSSELEPESGQRSSELREISSSCR